LLNTKKKRITAAAITVIAASAIGVAIAAWTTGGSGSGQAGRIGSADDDLGGHTELESVPDGVGGCRRNDQ
jgi:hypothetical protein